MEKKQMIAASQDVLGYGSDLIVKLLSSLGISYAVFNPGATFRGIHDSLVNYQGKNKPQIIECTHEEISIAIAHGYAKATGKPLAVLVHNVVGLMHASMAIFNAWCDRVPMLILGGTGPMDTSIRRPGIDWIHTALVQGNLVRDYVKWDDQPYTLSAVPESLLRGYRTSLTEPQGPIYICYDLAIQEEELSDSIEASYEAKDLRLPQSPQISDQNLMMIAKLIVEAKAPVILGDQVGRDHFAFDALLKLAELMSIPVLEPEKRVNSLNFPTCNELNLTGANEEILGGADLIIALEISDLFGALNKMDLSTRQFSYLPQADTHIIDIGLKDGSKNSWVQAYQRYQAVDISIQGAVGQILPGLLKCCEKILEGKKLKTLYDDRRVKLSYMHQKLREKWLKKIQQDKNKNSITKALLSYLVWEVIKDEDWILANGSLKGWVQKIWDIKDPEQWLGISGGAGLGYGLGASLGAAMAYRDSEKIILNLQADGDFLFTPSALWTAAHYNLPVLIIMDNNRCYANSWSHQSLVASNRSRSLENVNVGTSIDDPPVDYALLARSFGICAEGPVEKIADVRPALERALRVIKEQRCPVLVDIVTT